MNICLTTSASGSAVTWTSSSTTVATVSSSGIVTGVNVGKATITAQFTNSGSIYTATCKVYVTIADGVYRIKNNYSKLYLSTADRASSLANVYQETSDTGAETGLRQMWRIKYLADGYYSIRPMHNPSTALSVYNNDAYVNSIGTSDVLSGISLYAWWKISMFESFTYFYPASGAATALMLASDTTASGTNVTVSANNPSAARQQWQLERVSSPPSGVRWYDNLGNPLTGTPERYLTPGETPTLTSLKLKAVSYSNTNIDQTFGWSSANTDIAAVNAGTGQVTTVAPGTVTIRGRKVLNGQEKLLTFTLHVTEIPNGTYFIKSKLTGKMADIENQTMSDGTLIHQWEFHTGSTQRWIFTHMGDGYYTIKSEYSGSTAYYLGVQNDSTAQDAPIVLRSGAITDGMKWKISKTVYGAYKLTPKTGEANNRVLAIENNLLYENNGVKIRQRDYVEDDNFKDEWFITNSRYYATVNSYYDNGYSVRYGESSTTSSSNIKEYSDMIALRYFELLGLSLTVGTPTYYNSAIDKCKGTVTTSNIDTICTHSGTIHTNRSSVIADFKSHYSGNDKTTCIYWSGHKILSTATNGNPDVNRSCSSGNCIFLIEISNAISRTRDSAGVLMHELNHQYGAKDHYHELANKEDPTSCKFKDICSECGTNPRPSSCIMYQSRIDISADTVICEACKEDIIKHLKSHHLLP